jgi:DNA-binding ferritin-like protein
VFITSGAIAHIASRLKRLYQSKGFTQLKANAPTTYSPKFPIPCTGRHEQMQALILTQASVSHLVGQSESDQPRKQTMSGPHFRDYHVLFDEQGEQIFATTDDIAERIRKIGGTTLRSIGHIGRLQRVLDNDAGFVTPSGMLAELHDDNKQLAAAMREIHGLCDEHRASASLLETGIDQAERRTWFLFEASRSDLWLWHVTPKCARICKLGGRVEARGGWG